MKEQGAFVFGGDGTDEELIQVQIFGERGSQYACKKVGDEWVELDGTEIMGLTVARLQLMGQKLLREIESRNIAIPGDVRAVIDDILETDAARPLPPIPGSASLTPPPPPPTPSCSTSQYGCCPDNTTAKTDQSGSNCAPYPPPTPCSTSQYGCCPDNTTPKNQSGSNCSAPCSTFQYGCCPDNITTKSDQSGSNCAPYTGGCAGTIYGCCPDNKTAKTDSSGSNCPKTCSTSQYGCCPDNNTTKTDQSGSNCASYPPKTGGCAGTIYGCCPDNTTAKTDQSGSNCAPYPPVQINKEAVIINPHVQFKEVNPPVQSNTDAIFISNPFSTNTPTCPEPQPCPPCGRCPEPSFDCKKVPNYASTNSEYLPVPILNDFSQFGM